MRFDRSVAPAFAPRASHSNGYPYTMKVKVNGVWTAVAEPSPSVAGLVEVLGTITQAEIDRDPGYFSQRGRHYAEHRPEIEGLR